VSSLKITSVEIFDCEVNRKDPTMTAFNPVLIPVYTDEGVSGIGESASRTETRARPLGSVSFGIYGKSLSAGMR
jgi:L-alanine-DL-glutamate epimerase-like enolase superfamily enzyme